MTLAQTWMALAVVTAGATLQGSVGFGLGLLAAPLLVLIEPRLVPGPLLFVALFLSILVSIKYRASVHVAGVTLALAGRIPGVLLAVGLLATLPREQMTLAFASLVLVAIAMSASGLRFPERTWSLLTVGAVSGFMGTASSIGGPPMALVYQYSAGPRLRGTLGLYFALGVLMSLTALRSAGLFGRVELQWGLILLPGMLLGFAVSRKVAPLLDKGYTRASVLTVSTAGAMTVMLREIL